MKAKALAALAMMLAPALLHAEDAAPRARTDAPPIQAYKIVLVGDSTMAVHSGWGAAFCSNHVKSSIACLNLGRGGRSTRSYRAEGSWDVALAEAGVKGYKGSWVLIQFAHNDQSDKPERWTDMTTEFPANLARYVDEVRAAGATPVLLTPLTRREFRDGQLRNTLAPWAEEVRKVAVAKKVALVDLNARSAALVGKMGAATATKLAQDPPTTEELASAEQGNTLPPRPAPTEAAQTPIENSALPRGRVTRKFDYTHVGNIGAEVFARQVVVDLAAAVPELRSQLVP